MNTIFLYILLFIIAIPLVTGIAALIITGTRNRRHHATLLFHSVTQRRTLDQSHILAPTFGQLLSYLKQNKYTTITIRDLACHNKQTMNNQALRISLVFDDGFENFFSHALPLLNRYGYTAALFPVAGYIDSVSSWDVYAPYKQLSKEQLRLVADSGHEIGSHTLTHPDLALIDDNEVKTELSESKKILEDIISKPVTSLSFPFGSWNTRIWNIALECGYTAAVAYRGHAKAVHPIIPAAGVYAFDTLDDIIEKTEYKHHFSNARLRSLVMPHFAKGSPVWKFRKTYDVLRYFQ